MESNELVTNDESVIFSKRLWRSLVCVVTVDQENDRVLLALPTWGGNIGEREVWIELSAIPHEVKVLFHKGKYFYAKINLGAEMSSELIFADWEAADIRGRETDIPVKNGPRILERTLGSSQISKIYNDGDYFLSKQ